MVNSPRIYLGNHRTFVDQVMQVDQRSNRQAMLALGLFNVEGRLGQIRIPTLVTSGEEDSTIPLSTQRVLAERVPGARHLVIPGAGYALTIDRSTMLNRPLLDFLKEGA